MTLDACRDPRVKVFVNEDVNFSEQSKNKISDALELEDIREIVVLPDVHAKPDNPFPTGVVTLTKNNIYPCAIGQGIGCGMRLLKTSLRKEDLDGNTVDTLFNLLKKKLRDNLKKDPMVGKEEYLEILAQGRKWACRKYGIEEKASAFLEEVYGEAGPELSAREVISSLPKDALKGGHLRLGVLGSGNHFLEAQVIDDIFDGKMAEKLGLIKGEVIFLFHTDAGVLAKRLDNYYGIRFENNARIKEARKALRKYLFHFKDMKFWRFAKRKDIFFSKDFKGIPADSPEGKRFIVATQALLNYAFANRAVISDFIWQALRGAVKKDFSIQLLSDTVHERIDHEEFEGQSFWVHRNGATKVYCRNADREVLPIPAFMGGPSFLCLAKKGISAARYSLNHGVGRVFEKAEAKAKFDNREIYDALATKGIRLFKLGSGDVREQAPQAFKDIYKVIESLKSGNLVEPIVSTSPLAILKA